MNYYHELQWKSFKKEEITNQLFFNFPKTAKRKTSTVFNQGFHGPLKFFLSYHFFWGVCNSNLKV